MIYFLKAFTLLSAILYGLYFWTSFWQLKIILSSCKRAVQFYAGCISSCSYWKLSYGLYFVSDFAGFLLAKVSDFMCAFPWQALGFVTTQKNLTDFIQDMLSFPIFPFRVSGFTFNCGCFLRFCFCPPRILCCRLDVTSGFLWISAKQIWTLFYFLELWQLNLICAILCGRFSYWNLVYTVTSWVFTLLIINGCWFNLHVSFNLISRNSHYLKLIGLLVGCSISLLTFYFSKFLSTKWCFSMPTFPFHWVLVSFHRNTWFDLKSFIALGFWFSSFQMLFLLL